MKKLALELEGVLEVLDDKVAGYRQEVLSELIKQIMPELESRSFTVEDLLYSIIDYIAADPKLRRAVEPMESLITEIKLLRSLASEKD